MAASASSAAWPAGRARLRRARGALGARRELGLPARALLLAARSRGDGPGAGGPAPAGGHIGSLRCCIPTDDAGAILLAEHGRATAELPVPGSATGHASSGGGKYSLFQLCRALDMPSPRAMVPGSLAAARDFAAAAGYPLMAKLTTPWTQAAPRCAARRRRRRRAARIRLSGVRRGGHRPDAAGVHFRRHGHDWFFHGYCDAARRAGLRSPVSRSVPTRRTPD